MKQEEKLLADTEQKSERRRIQEENVRKKEEAKKKEIKEKERVSTHTFKLGIVLVDNNW